MIRLSRIVSWLIVIHLLGASRPMAAQQVLELQNGDRLTGAVKHIVDGSWVFAHAGGEVKISAADITAFTAPDPIGVRLVDGAIMAASIGPAGELLRLTAPDGSTRSVQPADLAAVGSPTNLPALEPVRIGYFSPIGKFWGATAGLGFSDKSGNSRSRGISASIEVARKSSKDRLTFKAGLAREDARVLGPDLETTVEKYYGSFRADVFFGPKFFVFGLTAQERDQFQDIDLRSNYNAGLGYQVIATDLTDLRFYASGGARVENFTSGGSTSTGIVGSGAGFRQVLGPVIFAWNGDWSPSVEDLNDYRLVSEASLTTTIYRGLGFRVGLRNELNNKPQAGIAKHDMLVTTALTYSIGP